MARERSDRDKNETIECTIDQEVRYGVQMTLPFFDPTTYTPIRQEFDTIITPDELEALGAGKESNPYWFMAIVEASKIQAERRKKYSGEQHPYYNFVDMAFRTKTPVFKLFRKFLHLKLVQLVLSPIIMFHIFKFYLSIKQARLAVGDTDFSDEKVMDTFLDIVNYAAIAAGWYLGGLELNDVIIFDDWERHING